MRELTLEEKFYGYRSVEEAEEAYLLNEKWSCHISTPQAVVGLDGHLVEPGDFSDYMEGWLPQGLPFSDPTNGCIYGTKPEDEIQLYEELKKIPKNLLFFGLERLKVAS